MTITLSEIQVKTIKQALEVFSRLKMGQFKIALEEAFPEKCLTKISDDQLYEANRLLKNLFFPEYCTGNPGICNDEVGKEAQIAYEINCGIEQYLALKKSDGWFESGKQYDGFYLNPSGEPFPKIEGLEEMQYKDFEIPENYQAQCLNLFEKQLFPLLWKTVKDNMSYLPQGEKQEIIKEIHPLWTDSPMMQRKSISEKLLVRVYKPKKPQNKDFHCSTKHEDLDDE